MGYEGVLKGPGVTDSFLPLLKFLVKNNDNKTVNDAVSDAVKKLYSQVLFHLKLSRSYTKHGVNVISAVSIRKGEPSLHRCKRKSASCAEILHRI
jgi:hypothetical protein